MDHSEHLVEAIFTRRSPRQENIPFIIDVGTSPRRPLLPRWTLDWMEVYPAGAAQDPDIPNPEKMHVKLTHYTFHIKLLYTFMCIRCPF